MPRYLDEGLGYVSVCSTGGMLAQSRRLKLGSYTCCTHQRSKAAHDVNHQMKTPQRLVHGWDRIKNLHFYSLLGLSTHKHVKCYPTMTKEKGRTGT